MKSVVEIGGWAIGFKGTSPVSAYPISEIEEWIMTCSLLRSGDKVVVVGAGEGIVQTAASLVAGVGNVMGYEAQRDVCERARGVRVDGRRLRVTNAAVVSDNSKVAEMVLGRHWSMGSLVGVAYEPKGKITVPAVNINDVLEDSNCLLMDAEGAEKMLLPAITEDNMYRLRAVLLEIHPKIVGDFDPEPLFNSYGLQAVEKRTNLKNGTRYLAMRRR